MSATGIRMTADELLRLPDNGMRRELVDGELHEMSPAGGDHGYVAGGAYGRPFVCLAAHPEVGGGLFAAETGFRLSRAPDTVRAPNVAYVSEQRLSQARVPGFPDMAPDLVVEVVSPNDTATEIQRKVDEWLAAEVLLVWVLYPATHSVRVFRNDGSTALLHAEDDLTADPVLPGFSCRVGNLFGDGGHEHMALTALEELLKLPPDERFESAMALCESLEDSDREEGFALAPELAAELDRRWAEHVADPGSAIPWEEVRKELRGNT